MRARRSTRSGRAFDDRVYYGRIQDEDGEDVEREKKRFENEEKGEKIMGEQERGGVDGGKRWRKGDKREDGGV